MVLANAVAAGRRLDVGWREAHAVDLERPRDWSRRGSFRPCSVCQLAQIRAVLVCALRTAPALAADEQRALPCARGFMVPLDGLDGGSGHS